jgi:hypothetical protein
MELQKTAMQMLIEHIEKLQKDNFISEVEYIKEKAASLLQIEKEQLINTFKDSQVRHAMQSKIRGEQFFNQTFKIN